MRRVLLGLICLAFIAGVAPAQKTNLTDGDLIICNIKDPATANYGPGSLLAMDPTTGLMYTFAPSLGTLNQGPNWIEIASDNRNFMVGMLDYNSSYPGPHFLSVDAKGTVLKTLMSGTTSYDGLLNAFELDYDGKWIISCYYRLYEYDENALTFSSFWYDTSRGSLNAIAIDRALGAADYVIGNSNSATSTYPRLSGADRTGYVSTISQANPCYVSAIRIDRLTGDYICSGFGIDGAGGGGEFMSVTKAGVPTTLNYPNTGSVKMYRANGLYLDKMRDAYILTYDWQTQPIPTLDAQYVCSVYKMDLNGVFITMYNFSSTLLRSNFAPAGITEYGSRHVVCNGTGKPGSTMKVKFTTRRPTEATEWYQLACSFGYTRGIKMPSGEWLNLTWDPLMAMTALNTAPGIFQGFAGQLVNGEASAAIQIPANLPPNLNMTVFVSGIVLDKNAPGGIGSVGNTHWFVLN